MRFVSLEINGLFLIEPEANYDHRGFFARTYCRDTFLQKGLQADFDQCSISFNLKRGTVRGLHFQKEPFSEVKLIRCLSGAVFDVVVDLRIQSNTYLKWVGVELTANHRKQLYVPKGCAHGFQTLCDDTEVFYQISQKHVPESASGVRFDDPLFGIQWPIPEKNLSERDKNFVNYIVHQ
jgi:dTDP-4-dehydrorhamnose 3,5-epimerase